MVVWIQKIGRGRGGLGLWSMGSVICGLCSLSCSSVLRQLIAGANSVWLFPWLGGGLFSCPCAAVVQSSSKSVTGVRVHSFVLVNGSCHVRCDEFSNDGVKMSSFLRGFVVGQFCLC